MLAYAKLFDYQLPDYDDFREWNVERQTPEHQRWVEEIGGLFDNMWVDECGRRFGKSVKWELCGLEEMYRRPGCRGMIAMPLRKSIGGVFVPIMKMMFGDAPDGYRPVYMTSHQADTECIVIPALDSVCKLVGLDKNPDATRGQFLDFCIISEAAYVKGLHDLITGVIQPQFRHRPWAWLALETSTAKVPDCDFNTQFREDAKLRGTYRMHTIRDTDLPDEEISREERRSGGKDSASCRRELYCEEIRDEDEMVVPEFDAPTRERPFTVHVVPPESVTRPQYALAHVGIDPGTTDPLGLCFFYFDWAHQQVVIEGAWQKANASTGEVVEVIHQFERELWGTEHKAPKTRGRELSIAAAQTVATGEVWDPPPGALTYWDVNTGGLKPNPYSRISDIAKRFILDMNADYAMGVRAADKGPGSAEADTEHMRSWFREVTSAGLPRIVILKNGKTDCLIEQLRSGTWNTDENGHRSDWVRSKTLGHLDALSALKYALRDVSTTRCPNRPGIVDRHMSDVHLPDRLRKTIKKPVPVRGGNRYAGAGGFGRTARH